ncbi:Alpha/Beta hydrolase protein [Xylariales sp. PMI_506]|nr:Alpha/Beta hydrolase protein [Xylariales sp. PMI_506]
MRYSYLIALLQPALVSSVPVDTDAAANSPGATPTVVLDYATYAGTQSGSGVNAFLGMRFAAPPLGDLRFRAPQDPNVESGVKDASAYGPICIGASQGESAGIAEDCLFVNVFAPANATKDSKLPVWLVIPGGGYQTNANENYNGTEVVLASGQNIVFVNFNYRVGMLGFLASEDIKNDGDLNAGLLDQRKVLAWVQKYISQFGGDPNHVVIHGISAGAGSVLYHLTAYGGRDDKLFQGAIAESSFWPTLPLMADVEYQYQRAINGTGCNKTDNPLSCLRSTDMSSLMAVNQELTFQGRNSTAAWYWLPVQDGDLIRGTRYSMLQSGQFIKVPLFVADDKDEAAQIVSDAQTSDDVKTWFASNYPKIEDYQLEEIVGQYPVRPALPGHGEWFPSLSAAYGDATFVCPGQALSSYMAQYSSTDQVWAYRCYTESAQTISAGLGTPHTFELPAIFGRSAAPVAAPSNWYEENAGIVPVIMHYYISFIRTLNPNTYAYAGAPEWNPWGSIHSNGKRLRLQDNGTRMEGVPLSEMQKCALWQGFADSMEV